MPKEPPSVKQPPFTLLASFALYSNKYQEAVVSYRLAQRAGLIWCVSTPIVGILSASVLAADTVSFAAGPPSLYDWFPSVPEIGLAKTLKAANMLELPESVGIYSVRRGRPVQAKLVRLDRQLAAQIDGTWWEGGLSKARKNEGDNHWLWRKLVGARRSDKAWEALAVQNMRGAVEGAMLHRIDAKSQLETGEGVVFIDRLATAPRNRPWLVESPEYRGVGSVLLLAAVRQSYSLGLGGRVWLTSLPNERTRMYYKRRGFVPIFTDEEGMIDFELPARKAQAWLQEEGYL